jgi:hypothetical protein
MQAIDYAIVVAYLIAMVAIGLLLQRRASAGIDSYFLGNRKLPWWVLGASGMASNLDVSGTMINTAWIFALGATGFFIEIRGGVTLIMAFLMIFMGKWNRRAEVMTLAEWMSFRFGKGREGDVARLIAAISNILLTIAMITYFAVGSGKFIGEFLGIPSFWGLSSEFWASHINDCACHDLYRCQRSLWRGLDRCISELIDFWHNYLHLYYGNNKISPAGCFFSLRSDARWHFSSHRNHPTSLDKRYPPMEITFRSQLDILNL